MSTKAGKNVKESCNCKALGLLSDTHSNSQGGRRAQDTSQAAPLSDSSKDRAAGMVTTIMHPEATASWGGPEGELTVTEVLEDVFLAGEIQLHFDVDGESGHLPRLQRKLGQGLF